MAKNDHNVGFQENSISRRKFAENRWKFAENSPKIRRKFAENSPSYHNIDPRWCQEMFSKERDVVFATSTKFAMKQPTFDLGSILQNSISAENFPDYFLSSNLRQISTQTQHI
jgi:hypothetical protein